MNPRPGRLWIIPLALATQAIAQIGLYWARAQNAKVSPGRFRELTPLLESDWAVFVAPALFATFVLCLVALVSSKKNEAARTPLLSAAACTPVVFIIALVVSMFISGE